MALIASLAALGGVAAFAFLFTAFGHRLLRVARMEMGSSLEHLLCSAAAGFIAYEATLALSEFFVPARISVVILLAAAAAAGLSEWRAILRALSEIIRRVAQGARSEHCLAGLVGVVLFAEGLAATAPLTGSDALHYHFAMPLHLLRGGFHPDFFLTTSFLIGQGHLLILSGLALGSEKLAMGLLFLPGALTAAASACLARKWVSPFWAWVVALAFLLNPVVFWQATASGAPDLWMAFFATAAVLAVIQASATPSAGLALLCGFLAGGIAGAKYTGCLTAAALLVAFVVETRTLSRAALFFTASLTAGAWPYLRNLLWTSDPVFPFGLRWIAPARVNAYGLAALVDATVVQSQRTFAAVSKFPLFAAVDSAHTGFWEFFGPLILIFAPAFLLWKERTAAWRVTLVVCLLGTLAIGRTSGMARYALPFFPLALAAAFAGAAELRARRWRIAWVLSLVSIAGFLLLGLGGLAVYTRPAIAASLGLIDRETFLQQRSPEYAISAFVNRALAGKERDGYALVFFRHTYYLQVPYLNGDPQDSWAVDPTRLATPRAWREFLRGNRIRWIVRAPDYPEEVAAPLEQLEQTGSLVFFAREDVTTFEGMRILGVRRTFAVTVLRAND